MKKIQQENGETPDQKAFREAMRDVKPLKTVERVLPVPKKPKASVRPRSQDTQITDSPLPFSDYEKLPPVTGNQQIQYAKSGVHQKTLRKLARGQYNPDAVLDLHGRTVAEARSLLGRFLTNCQNKSIRHVLIIHGKGNGFPVLKNRLNHWLREAAMVSAFCSAPERLGGTGALCVCVQPPKGEKF